MGTVKREGTLSILNSMSILSYIIKLFSFYFIVGN